MAQHGDKQSTDQRKEHREAESKALFLFPGQETKLDRAAVGGSVLGQGGPLAEAVPQSLPRYMEVHICLLKYCLSRGKTKSNTTMKTHTMVVSATSKAGPRHGTLLVLNSIKESIVLHLLL